MSSFLGLFVGYERSGYMLVYASHRNWLVISYGADVPSSNSNSVFFSLAVIEVLLCLRVTL